MQFLIFVFLLSFLVCTKFVFVLNLSFHDKNKFQVFGNLPIAIFLIFDLENLFQWERQRGRMSQISKVREFEAIFPEISIWVIYLYIFI